MSYNKVVMTIMVVRSVDGVGDGGVGAGGGGDGSVGNGGGGAGHGAGGVGTSRTK